MPQGYTESPYFSQILKADQEDIKLPRGPLCLICGWFASYLSFSSLSTGRQRLLAKASVLKRHRLPKKIFNLPTSRFDIKNRAILWSKQNSWSCFSKSKSKCQLQGFIKLVDYCQNWISNFRLMAQSLYAVLNNTNLHAILGEEADNIVFKALKENLMDLLTLGYPSYEIPFILFCIWKGREALWVCFLKLGDYKWPIVWCIISCNWTLWYGDNPNLCLKTITATVLLVKSTDNL